MNHLLQHPGWTPLPALPNVQLHAILLLAPGTRFGHCATWLLCCGFTCVLLH